MTPASSRMANAPPTNTRNRMIVMIGRFPSAASTSNGEVNHRQTGKSGIAMWAYEPGTTISLPSRSIRS